MGPGFRRLGVPPVVVSIGSTNKSGANRGSVAGQPDVLNLLRRTSQSVPGTRSKKRIAQVATLSRIDRQP
jgi:hypothetical protein